jgi:acyl-homoserine-lactone acylase
MKGLLIAIASIICLATTAQQKPLSITWDNWGVPHIAGNTDEELMYADGWAQMQLHADLITQLYGRARGRGAEYWGKQKLQEDILINTLGFPELAADWTAKANPSWKKMVTAFVKGLNDYASAHPESIKPENRLVLPLTEKDIASHLAFVVFGRFVGGEELGNDLEWKEMGSNAVAIGPKKSASKKAMLVMNPHLPWFGEFLFTELHLMKPGYNMYGATLVGFPGIAIAFNENLGWSHTNNTIDNADTYELQLKDGGYLLDGQRKEFTTRKKTIKVRDENGAMVSQEITILNAEQGPVVNMGKEKALAIRMAGVDKPDIGLQWWKMAQSRNFSEFESALKMAQIPFWNVMYADKAGNIFYLFNGLVPKRSDGDWKYWNSIVKGGKSSDIWTSYHSYDELPKVKNPETGWLQNTNDPPWTSTLPRALDANKFPAYMSPRYMDFRTQSSVHMFQDDPSITYEELIQYKHSTHMELADRLLDDLFKAIDQFGADSTKEAKKVLEQWDRNADNESKGAVLFYSWAQAIQVNSNSIYAVKWDENNPRATPDGLADPKKAVDILNAVSYRVKSVYGRLDIPWGELMRLRSKTVDLPGNGADGSVGCFRVTWDRPGENGKFNIIGGDSWVGVLEFGEKVKASVLLSYGNSSQDGNVHNGDQLKLFSEKKLRVPNFYPEEIQKNKVRTEVLKNGKFATE